MYRFTYRSTSGYKRFDSAHGLEVPFVFGVIDDLDVIVFTGRDPYRRAVMKQVQQAWINFARTGDPSQPSLAWPKYDENTRATMQLGKSCNVANVQIPRSVPFGTACHSMASRQARLMFGGSSMQMAPLRTAPYLTLIKLASWRTESARCLAVHR